MTSSWSEAPSLLSLIGAVMVYSATRVELTAVGVDPKFYLKRQLVWLAIGLVVMVVVALVDYHWLEQWAYVIYGLDTFSVKMDRGGQTMVTTYTGTFSGDDLKLKQTRQGRNGEQTTDIAAKRSTT